MVHPRIVTLCQTHNKSTTTLLCPTATRTTGSERTTRRCSTSSKGATRSTAEPGAAFSERPEACCKDVSIVASSVGPSAALHTLRRNAEVSSTSMGAPAVRSVPERTGRLPRLSPARAEAVQGVLSGSSAQQPAREGGVRAGARSGLRPPLGRYKVWEGLERLAAGLQPRSSTRSSSSRSKSEPGSIGVCVPRGDARS